MGDPWGDPVELQGYQVLSVSAATQIIQRFFRSEYLAFGLYQWWGPSWGYVDFAFPSLSLRYRRIANWRLHLGELCAVRTSYNKLQGFQMNEMNEMKISSNKMIITSS